MSLPTRQLKHAGVTNQELRLNLTDVGQSRLAVVSLTQSKPVDQADWGGRWPSREVLAMAIEKSDNWAGPVEAKPHPTRFRTIWGSQLSL
jgi:hypothetical protein